MLWFHCETNPHARLTEDLVDKATGMRLLPANSVVTITCEGPIDDRFYTIEEVDGIMVNGENLANIHHWPYAKLGDTVFLLPNPYPTPYSWKTDPRMEYEILGFTCKESENKQFPYEKLIYNLLSESGQEITVWETHNENPDYWLVGEEFYNMSEEGISRSLSKSGGYVTGGLNGLGVPVIVKKPLKAKVHKI